MKIYGLLPAALSHQSRTSIAALHSLLHVPCRHAALLNPNAAAKQPQTKSMRQKLTRKERFVHKFSDILFCIGGSCVVNEYGLCLIVIESVLFVDPNSIPEISKGMLQTGANKQR